MLPFCYPHELCLSLQSILKNKIGSYGTVKEALDQDTSERVAIKICKNHCLRKIPGGVEHVLEEIKILESLDHPNVIKMYSHWKEEEKLYVYDDSSYLFFKTSKNIYFNPGTLYLSILAVVI